MQRSPHLSPLASILVTGLLTVQALAAEPTDAGTRQSSEEPKEAEQSTAASTPPAPAAPAGAAEAAAGGPAVAAIAPAAKVKAGDLSVHGYFRGGFGANYNERGRASCFGLASINGSLKSKYRLGNECEQWAELLLSAVVYVADDGTVGTFHFMPVAFIPTTYIGFPPAMTTSAQDQQGQTSTGATVAFPTIYADLKGIGWLHGGAAWVGSRYYKRESVYISDFFYWNPSGVGAGIEDAFQLGKIWTSAPRALKDLAFSYGAFAVDGQPNGNPFLPQRYALGIRNDFQLRGLRPYESGEIQIGFQYIANWSNANNDVNEPAPTHSGWGVTVRHVQEILGGDNKLVFQYGRGGGTGFGTLARFYYPDFSLNQDLSESRLRIVDVLTIQPTRWLGAQAAFVFQRDRNLTPAAGDWYSTGARVSLAFTKHTKLLGEAGHDSVIPTNGSGRRMLTKLTGAVAVTADRGFMARPELRLFATWAVWNEAARIAGIDSRRLYTDFYSNILSGTIFGLQAETWW